MKWKPSKRSPIETRERLVSAAIGLNLPQGFRAITVDQICIEAGSSYAQAREQLIGAFQIFDLLPKGRNEPGGIMRWVYLHDEYEQKAPPCGCCHQNKKI